MATDGDISSRNVFEQNDPMLVDAVVFDKGVKKIVGKALVTTDDEGNIEINLDLDTSNPLSKQFIPHLDAAGFTAREEDAVVVDTDIPKHDHKPVQHRDGKPPWCNICGLTIGYLKPNSRIPKR